MLSPDSLFAEERARLEALELGVLSSESALCIANSAALSSLTSCTARMPSSSIQTTPAGKSGAPAARPLDRAFNKIVLTVTAQSAGQETAFRPISGAPFAGARFDAELTLFVVDSLMAALPRSLGKTSSDWLDGQISLPIGPGWRRIKSCGDNRISRLW